VLINMSSVVGKLPAPYQSAYVVSKYATRALSESVRQEVQDVAGISVCTVLPGPVDTPLFRSGANLTGQHITPPAQASDARQVASAIVGCAERPRAEVRVGASTTGGLLANRLLPRLTEKVFGRMVDRVHFAEEPVGRSEGNLFEPSPTGEPQPYQDSARSVALGSCAVGRGSAKPRDIRASMQMETGCYTRTDIRIRI
jgi:hypothetical protein